MPPPCSAPSFPLPASVLSLPAHKRPRFHIHIRVQKWEGRGGGQGAAACSFRSKYTLSYNVVNWRTYSTRAASLEAGTGVAVLYVPWTTTIVSHPYAACNVDRDRSNKSRVQQSLFVGTGKWRQANAFLGNLSEANSHREAKTVWESRHTSNGVLTEHSVIPAIDPAAAALKLGREPSSLRSISLYVWRRARREGGCPIRQIDRRYVKLYDSTRDSSYSWLCSIEDGTAVHLILFLPQARIVKGVV